MINLQSTRRFDIDWIRVIAIGLLLLYHTAIGFQSWGILIGFISKQQSWDALWMPMTMLNVWRIPLLFFVSGMGVSFAMENRNWKQLLADRAYRILVPFLFGMFVIFPVSLLLLQYYYHWELKYEYQPGHLWFLGNIFLYVLILMPLFYYLKKCRDRYRLEWMKRLLANPVVLLFVPALFAGEAILLDPLLYEMYAMTWHGFFLGLLAFMVGFCLVLCGQGFWPMLLKWRWPCLVGAIAFYLYRLSLYPARVPNYLLSTESILWIFSIFGFGFRYLNRPGKLLHYLSQAAYPVYILHMIFLYLGAILIFPMKISVPFQFILLFLFTLAGSFVFYELIVRRVTFIRPLFGLKRLSPQEKSVERP